jgi:hypothetical protein
VNETECDCKTDLSTIDGLKWNQLPPETRIGWRGPAILWEKLDRCPPIFWSDDDSISF